MKKISFLTICLLSICLIACSSNATNLTFSEYYQNADDFEEIEPLLNDYFSCIQTAYDKSDKVNLESFNLPDNYDNIANELSIISKDNSNAIVDGKTNLSEEYIARLKLLEPYLRVQVYLVEKDLLIVGADSNIVKNEKWFEKLNELLTNTYSEYENGNGE